MREVRVGDKVRSNVTEFDVKAGRLYRVQSVELSGVWVWDDADETYFLLSNEYTFEQPKPSTITDITGIEVYVGDTVAYAFAGAQSRHLALFEVQEINGPVALCRAKSDGAVINLGVFEERAIKIKE